LDKNDKAGDCIRDNLIMKLKLLFSIIGLCLLYACNNDYPLYLINKTGIIVQETVTPVTINGKQIGDVDNIIPTERGVEIAITIYGGLQIPANSVFTIIKGEKDREVQISVRPGSSKVYLQEEDIIIVTNN
jgi:hypothetical protein